MFFFFFFCFRFDSNQVELNEQVKSEDKLWLVRHLERMRIMILEDLINVKVRYLTFVTSHPLEMIFKIRMNFFNGLCRNFYFQHFVFMICDNFLLLFQSGTHVGHVGRMQNFEV